MLTHTNLIYILDLIGLLKQAAYVRCAIASYFFVAAGWMLMAAAE